MADDNPFKIRFRFYAIDDEIRNDSSSVQDGLIVVSKRVVERLKNDSQLAAVLADGVAFAIERQGAKRNLELGLDSASLALAAASPVAALGFAQDGDLPNQQLARSLTEQRGRVALSLMADAGYDPWQAPEAWRLLAPKHVPSDTNSLKYPDFSGYQLGLLNLQYKKLARPHATSAEEPR